MDFSQVNEITIPEGSVEKITETETGRLLWEKFPKLTPSWTVTTVLTHMQGWNNQPPLLQIPYKREEKILNHDGSVFLDYVEIFFLEQGARYNSEDYSDNAVVEALRLYIVTPVGGVSVPPPENITLKLENNTICLCCIGSVSPAYYYIALCPDNNEHNFSALFLGKDVSQNKPYFITIRKNGDTPATTRYYLNVSSNASHDKISIIYNPERQEFLINGLGTQTIIVSKSNSSIEISYVNTPSLKRVKWIKELGLYFGATGTDNRLYYSQDGMSWNSVKVFRSNHVFGVEWLSEHKQLCALSTVGKQIGFSPDGINWEVDTMPNITVLAYGYSPDYKTLCVLSNGKVYITQNMRNWLELALPDSKQVNFVNMFYVGAGLFLCYAFRGRDIYCLSLQKELILSEGKQENDEWNRDARARIGDIP